MAWRSCSKSWLRIEDSALDPFSLRLSQQDHGPPARNHRRPRQDLLLHRCAFAARIGGCSEAHEAGRRRRVFLRSIEKMRRTIPGVTLRTSFIVGFPGETEKEFEELCEFVREAEVRLDGRVRLLGPGGRRRIFTCEEKLPSREIERRRKHLMQIQRQISKQEKEGAGRQGIRSVA